MLIAFPATPLAAVIQRALGEFELLATDEQVRQFNGNMEILLLWNEKINLTAIRDPLEILYRHFCESMYAAKVLAFEAVGSPTGVRGRIPMPAPEDTSSRICSVLGRNQPQEKSHFSRKSFVNWRT